MKAPTADEVRTARIDAGLTQTEAAALVHFDQYQSWSKVECGRAGMARATWELFLIKIGLHPDLMLMAKNNIEFPPGVAVWRPKKAAPRRSR